MGSYSGVRTHRSWEVITDWHCGTEEDTEEKPSDSVTSPIERSLCALEESSRLIDDLLENLDSRRVIGSQALNCLEQTLSNINNYDDACLNHPNNLYGIDPTASVAYNDEISKRFEVFASIEERYASCMRAIDMNMTIVLRKLAERVINPMWEWIDEDPSFEEMIKPGTGDYPPPDMRSILLSFTKNPAPIIIPEPATLRSPPRHEHSIATHVSPRANLRVQSSLMRASSILAPNPGWT